MAHFDTPPWQFSRALLRNPATSAIKGLRAVDRGEPSLDGLIAEHSAYAEALRQAGVEADILPALEQYPDSMFIEDPALTFPECAIVLRPGAPSRFGEAAEIAPILGKSFETVHHLPAPGFVDGGDILVASERVYIGLSSRTDRTGADALRSMLADTGRPSQIVEPPLGVLHLKSACSLLAENMLLATDEMADSGLFAEMDIVRVPNSEAAAANSLRVNDVVLVGVAFAETRKRLETAGYNVVSVPIAEVGKLDAGLSCMSLRW
jgi:dimethylargininase